MPNIASLLKAEIARVARREVRVETAAMKKATSGYRVEIATLKRRTQSLEQDVRRLSKGAAKAKPDLLVEASDVRHRFSAKGLASARQRLGLSGADCGLLVGASPQSIYNWEQGKAKPLSRHMSAIAALRAMGRREAEEQLRTARSTSA